MNFQDGGLGAEDLTIGHARSCDITPCYFFFIWGWAKHHINAPPPSNIEEHEVVIRDVLTNVIRKAVLEEVPARLRGLTERNGGYVEI